VAGKLPYPLKSALPPEVRQFHFNAQGGTVAARNEEVRAPWVKPTLVQRPLEETRSGRGTVTDGLPDFQS
jgi:hypothetical protein